jgi:altronate hydrolase
VDKVLAIAGGEPARNETNGFREITIWKQGVTL